MVETLLSEIKCNCHGFDDIPSNTSMKNCIIALCLYPVNFPKHYDEQRDSNSAEYIDEEPERVVVHIPVLHSTHQGRKPNQSIAICQESCYHTWYGDDEASNGCNDVEIFLLLLMLSSMKGKHNFPEDAADMGEPPSSQVDEEVLPDYACVCVCVCMCVWQKRTHSMFAVIITDNS